MLRDLLTKVEAIGNFQKVFNKGSTSSTASFSTLETLWGKMVTAGVRPPAAVEAEMCAKKIDEYLSNDKVNDALRLISIVAPDAVDGEGKVWTLAAITDKTAPAETCSTAGVKVFSKIFSYRLPQGKTQEEAEKAVPEFMAKVNELTLPPDMALQVKTIAAVTDWKFNGTTSEDSSGLKAADNR